MSFPLCKYALLQATVNVLETFMKAIFRKRFHVFKRIRMILVASQKRSPTLLISVEGTGSQVRKMRGLQVCRANLC
jgi:hypothetical protein